MKAKEVLAKNAVEIQKKDHVSTLAGQIKQKSASHAYIMDHKIFLGIFSPDHLFRSRKDIYHLKAEKFVKKVSRLDSEDNLLEIALKMFKSDSFLLPVYEKQKTEKRFIGVVEVFDLFKNMVLEKEFGWLSKINSSELKTDSSTVSDKEMIGQALHLMTKKRRRELPVVDEKLNVIGMLNHNSLLEKYYSFQTKTEHRQKPKTKTRGYQANPNHIFDLPVGDFMQEEMPYDAYNAKNKNLLEVILLMATKRVTTVILRENPVETLSASEVLRKIAEVQPKEQKLVRFVGLHKIKIDDTLKKRMDKAAELHTKKLARRIHDDFNVIIHIKEHHKQGTRSRYEVHTRLDWPRVPLIAKTEEWNLITAIQNSFDEIMEQIGNKFKKE